MLQSLLLRAALLPGVLGAALAPEHPEAPDGRRGFGDSLTIAEVQDVLFSKDEEDQAFVRGLLDLKSRVEVRLGRLRVEYEQAGYFGLLPPTAEHELPALHDAFWDGLARAHATFDETGAFPEAMARLWSDVAFVLRAELLASLEVDLHDLRGGLAFLMANRDGYADVRDAEVRLVTPRIDLAAARLRALLLDLDALSQSESWSASAEQLRSKLVGLAQIPDRARRTEELARLEQQLHDRLEAARSVLFSARLAERTQRASFERDRAVEEAADYLAEVRLWIPDAPESADAPPEIAEEPKHRRYGYALRLSVGGLGLDPLNTELCYWAGRASEFLYGELESMSWYDRFLALSGIRAHLTSTTKGRSLTARERHALDVVQRYERLQQGRLQGDRDR